MPLLKNAVTNLSQGVSQQAESQRYPSQATEQINAFSSHIKGLVKRPPTEHIVELGLPAANPENSFLHVINRDENERYALVISSGSTNTFKTENVNTTDNTITFSNNLTYAVGDKIQFYRGSQSVLPTGILEGRVYFVRTADNTEKKITLSDTKGGTEKYIGRSTTSTTDWTVDDGKNGFTIESIKVDGIWTDGVLTVRISSVESGTPHNFADGEGVTFNANHFPVDGILHSLVTSTGKDFKLVKRNTMAGAGANENKHWITDSAGNHVTDTGGEWLFLSGLEFELSSSNDTLTTDGTIPALVVPGTLLKIGNDETALKAERRLVKSVDTIAKTITLTEELSSLSDPVKLRVWAPKGVTNASRQFTNGVDFDTTTYIGTDGLGVNNATGPGKGATGPEVFDLITGDRQDVRIEPSTLSYLTDITNPSRDLAAVTVADYTFLVNKTKKIRRHGEAKHDKRHEAFVSIKQADYGKKYTINIGEQVIDPTTGDVASFTIQGRTFDSSVYDGYEFADEDVLKITAKNKGPEYNGFTFKLITNWSWNKDWTLTTVSSTDPNGFVVNDPTESNVTTSIPPASYRDKNVRESEDTTCAFYYDHDSMEMIAWVNFEWTNSGNTITTVQNLVDLMESQVNTDSKSFRDYWDVTATINGNDKGSSHFWKLYLGAKDEKSAITLLDSTQSNGETTTEEKFFEIGPNSMVGAVRTVIDTTYSGQYRGFDNPKGQINVQEVIVTHAGGLHPTAAASDSKISVVRYTNTKGGTGTPKGDDFDETDGSSIGGKKDILSLPDGEFFYKTPLYQTDTTKRLLTGTERIASYLASDAIIRCDAAGVYQDPSEAWKKSDGTGAYKTQGVESGERAFGLLAKPHTDFSDTLVKYSAASRIGDFEQDWFIDHYGNTVSIKAPQSGYNFDIKVNDDLGGNGMSLTYLAVEEAAKLPNICRNGHVVKVVGDAREEADDYYLRFDSQDGDGLALKEGLWNECVGYDMPYKLDSSTMPLVLIRESTGTFVLKQAGWSERSSGDDQSNPFPSFYSNSIENIFFFKNRLGFLSGENIILSEAGEYFNFFRTTTAALLDSDPIDVTASTNKVSNLKNALPLSDKLLLFSEQTQFSLQGEQILTPKTVSITPTTEFVSVTACNPVLSGKTVFYAFPRTNFGGVAEYFTSMDQVETMDSRDISAHIPKYIKGNVVKFSACPSEDVLVCITDDTNNTTGAVLYIYKYFLAHNNQKMQSAWFKYITGEDGDRILSVEFVNNTLYLIIKRGDEVYLESLLFEDAQKDANMDYKVLLDRRVVYENGDTNVSYANSNTTVTLPYLSTAKTRVVTAASVLYEPSTTNSKSFVIAGVDLTGTVLYSGELYDMEYTLSKPHLRQGGGQEGRGVLVGGRQQLRRGTLEFTNARTFDVDVTHQPANNSVKNSYSFNGVELGYASAIIGSDKLSEGFYKFAILGRNDRVTLKVTNTTPYPADFLSLDYEGTIYSRGKRWVG